VDRDLPVFRRIDLLLPHLFDTLFDEARQLPDKIFTHLVVQHVQRVRWSNREVLVAFYPYSFGWGSLFGFGNWRNWSSHMSRGMRRPSGRLNDLDRLQKRPRHYVWRSALELRGELRQGPIRSWGDAQEACANEISMMYSNSGPLLYR